MAGEISTPETYRGKVEIAAELEPIARLAYPATQQMLRDFGDCRRESASEVATLERSFTWHMNQHTLRAIQLGHSDPDRGQPQWYEKLTLVLSGNGEGPVGFYLTPDNCTTYVHGPRYSGLWQAQFLDGLLVQCEAHRPMRGHDTLVQRLDMLHGRFSEADRYNAENVTHINQGRTGHYVVKYLESEGLRIVYRMGKVSSGPVNTYFIGARTFEISGQPTATPEELAEHETWLALAVQEHMIRASSWRYTPLSSQLALAVGLLRSRTGNTERIWTADSLTPVTLQHGKVWVSLGETPDEYVVGLKPLTGNHLPTGTFRVGKGRADDTLQTMEGKPESKVARELAQRGAQHMISEMFDVPEPNRGDYYD